MTNSWVSWLAGRAGPYEVVRASVVDVQTKLFPSERGSQIGLRLNLFGFLATGSIAPVPQVYPGASIPVIQALSLRDAQGHNRSPRLMVSSIG
jgi:hypothetical protein